MFECEVLSGQILWLNPILKGSLANSFSLNMVVMLRL